MRLCCSLAEARTLGQLRPAESLYSSDDWLDLLHDHGHVYRYLLCTDSDASALVLLTEGASVRPERFRPAILLDARLSTERCRVAGPLTGYHNELRSSSAAPSKGTVADSLLESAYGATTLLPYLPSALAAGFEAEGHPAGLIAWEAWLDVPDTGFEGYLAQLSRQQRDQVKGDLRQVARAGLTFHTGPLAAPFEPLADLLVLHERKYDPSYDQPSWRFAQYLARCSEVPGAYAVLARQEGRIVGCHVVFHYGDTLWVRLIGVDESPETRRCYFSLMFYEPLQLAHRLGARTVHLGIGSSEAKARRGARMEPLWTVGVAPGGRTRDAVRAGLAARAANLPDPVPARLVPPPVSPSAGSAPQWTA
ncbi:GNAT family N-acetyltransferase [Streptomyces sioyaensis]|uniref:GNAT family N-acetyltransferase n=1 Tax=Streptomyces sioyaensis TaxID=67364 RepID=UPI003797ABB8